MDFTPDQIEALSGAVRAIQGAIEGKSRKPLPKRDWDLPGARRRQVKPRRVATPAGERMYGQRIGEVIALDASPEKPREVTDTPTSLEGVGQYQVNGPHAMTHPARFMSDDEYAIYQAMTDIAERQAYYMAVLKKRDFERQSRNRQDRERLHSIDGFDKYHVFAIPEGRIAIMEPLKEGAGKNDDWDIVDGHFVFPTMDDLGVLIDRLEELRTTLTARTKVVEEEEAKRVRSAISFISATLSKLKNRKANMSVKALQELVETKVRRVRDPDYWGAPINTIITPDMKPRSRIRKYRMTGKHKPRPLTNDMMAPLSEWWSRWSGKSEISKHVRRWLSGNGDMYLEGRDPGTSNVMHSGEPVQSPVSAAALVAQITQHGEYKTTYRGLVIEEDVYDHILEAGTFDEPIGTSTGQKQLAEEFALGFYGWGGEVPEDHVGVVMVLHGPAQSFSTSGDEGATRSLGYPPDEHWVSGRFRVTAVSQVRHPVYPTITYIEAEYAGMLIPGDIEDKGIDAQVPYDPDHDYNLYECEGNLHEALNETKSLQTKERRVRTQAGVRRFKLPINSIIGFTGTQSGMTTDQYAKVQKIVAAAKPSEAHHGDCLGADTDFHDIVDAASVPIVIHPPTDAKKRAYNIGGTLRKKKPYLDRNKDIVDESDVVIATPKGNKEELRSGTWATIRAARKAGKRVIVVWPDGSTEDSADDVELPAPPKSRTRTVDGERLTRHTDEEVGAAGWITEDGWMIVGGVPMSDGSTSYEIYRPKRADDPSWYAVWDRNVGSEGGLSNAVALMKTLRKEAPLKRAHQVWESDSGHRAIRRGAYVHLGYDLSEPTPIDNRDYTTPDYADERYPDAEDHAVVLMDELTKAKPPAQPRELFRSAYLPSDQATTIMAELKRTDTFDAPLVSFSTDRKKARSFNSVGIMFVLEPGAKSVHLRNAFFDESEEISGGRFQITYVHGYKNGYYTVGIKQIGVFDSTGKLHTKSGGGKHVWALDYLLDGRPYQEELAESKGDRHVRTPEGVRRYGKPINALITDTPEPPKIRRRVWVQRFDASDVPDLDYFMAEPNPPAKLYHVAPKAAREDIAENGLDATDKTWNTGASEGWYEDEWLWAEGDDGEKFKYEYRPTGVYMFQTLESARQYNSDGKGDIYEIDTEENDQEIVRDPSQATNWDWIDDSDRAYVTRYVAPEALRIVGDTETKTRHVRDADFWDAPVGTPLPLPEKYADKYDIPVGTIDTPSLIGAPHVESVDGRLMFVPRVSPLDRMDKGFVEPEPTPVEWLYRSISEDEWQSIQERGYIQSDGRMNLADWEGTCAATRDPSFYLPPQIGERGRIIKFKYDPEDEWWIDSDGYAKTPAKIPAERIVEASPWYIKGKPEADYSYSDLMQDTFGLVSNGIASLKDDYRGPNADFRDAFYALEDDIRKTRYDDHELMTRHEYTLDELTDFIIRLDELGRTTESEEGKALVEDTIARARRTYWLMQRRETKMRHVATREGERRYGAPIGTPLPIPDGTQLILPRMPSAPVPAAAMHDDSDRIANRPMEDIDSIRKGARHMQSLIDEYHDYDVYSDSDYSKELSERHDDIARQLRDVYGINVYDETWDDGDTVYGDTLVSSSQWIYFGGCRDIRESAYDILGFDEYDRGADPHLNGGAPDWGMGSGGGSQPELMAFALLDKLKDADHTTIPVYRGVDMQGTHVGGFLEDLRQNPMFDLPLASFAGNQKAASKFGTDVIFKVQPGARHLQGGFMGNPDDEDGEGLEYYEEQSAEYAEIVTGGRFKVVGVREEQQKDKYGDYTGVSTVVVTIRQVAVFDPATGMSQKAVNRRWKWAYLFDNSLAAKMDVKSAWHGIAETIHELEAKVIRHVRDPDYWGLPMGAVIPPGYKPSGPTSPQGLAALAQQLAGKTPEPSWPEHNLLPNAVFDELYSPLSKPQEDEFHVDDVVIVHDDDGQEWIGTITGTTNLGSYEVTPGDGNWGDPILVPHERMRPVEPPTVTHKKPSKVAIAKKKAAAAVAKKKKAAKHIFNGTPVYIASLAMGGLTVGRDPNSGKYRVWFPDGVVSTYFSWELERMGNRPLGICPKEARVVVADPRFIKGFAYGDVRDWDGMYYHIDWDNDALTPNGLMPVEADILASNVIRIDNLIGNISSDSMYVDDYERDVSPLRVGESIFYRSPSHPREWQMATVSTKWSAHAYTVELPSGVNIDVDRLDMVRAPRVGDIVMVGGTNGNWLGSVTAYNPSDQTYSVQDKSGKVTEGIGHRLVDKAVRKPSRKAISREDADAAMAPFIDTQRELKEIVAALPPFQPAELATSGDETVAPTPADIPVDSFVIVTDLVGNKWAGRISNGPYSNGDYGILPMSGDPLKRAPIEHITVVRRNEPAFSVGDLVVTSTNNGHRNGRIVRVNGDLMYTVGYADGSWEDHSEARIQEARDTFGSGDKLTMRGIDGIAEVVKYVYDDSDGLNVITVEHEDGRLEKVPMHQTFPVRTLRPIYPIDNSNYPRHGIDHQQYDIVRVVPDKQAQSEHSYQWGEGIPDPYVGTIVQTSEYTGSYEVLDNDGVQHTVFSFELRPPSDTDVRTTAKFVANPGDIVMYKTPPGRLKIATVDTLNDNHTITITTEDGESRTYAPWLTPITRVVTEQEMRRADEDASADQMRRMQEMRRPITTGQAVRVWVPEDSRTFNGKRYYDGWALRETRLGWMVLTTDGNVLHIHRDYVHSIDAETELTDGLPSAEFVDKFQGAMDDTEGTTPVYRPEYVVQDGRFADIDAYVDAADRDALHGARPTYPPKPVHQPFLQPPDITVEVPAAGNIIINGALAKYPENQLKSFVMFSVARHIMSDAEQDPDLQKWLSEQQLPYKTSQSMLDFVYLRIMRENSGSPLDTYDVVAGRLREIGFSEDDITAVLAPDMSIISVDPDVPNILIGTMRERLDHLSDEDKEALARVVTASDIFRTTNVGSAPIDLANYASYSTTDLVVLKLSDEYVQQWATSAYDSNTKSIAVQIAAERVFGLDLALDRSVDYNTRIAYADALRKYEEDRPFLEAYVRAVYQNTQDFLSTNGISELTLYRGLQIDTSLGMPDWFRNIVTSQEVLDQIDVEASDYADGFLDIYAEDNPDDATPEALARMRETLIRNWKADNEEMRSQELARQVVSSRPRSISSQALSSWSTSLSTARDNFAGSAGDDDGGIVLAATVPAQRVFSTTITGNGCSSEFELVVIGGNHDPATVVLT